MSLSIVRSVLIFGIVASAANGAEALEHRTIKVDGVEREALVYAPASAKSSETPLVFGFHGHGGNMKQFAEKFNSQKLWPEAIAVYMQGLPTPGRLTDPEGKRAGWQGRPGDQDDRDLKFFDAALAELKQAYKVDTRRIYTTGHSNGGGFTYLLWHQRGDVFAAVAPCAAFTAQHEKLNPLPAFHLAGEKDPLVKFEWQKLTIDALKKLNGCGEGQPWHDEKWCTQYESKSGTPLVTCIHPGGHELPAEVPAMIVRFFKEHQKPEKSESSAGK